jgi:hypothetical protein
MSPGSPVPGAGLLVTTPCSRGLKYVDATPSTIYTGWVKPSKNVQNSTPPLLNFGEEPTTRSFSHLPRTPSLLRRGSRAVLGIQQCFSNTSVHIKHLRFGKNAD